MNSNGHGGRLSPFLTAAAAVIITLLIASGLLFIGGYSPVEAFAALLRGSFGSWSSFTSSTLVRATPLLWTGLAVTLAFKAGVWNIGAEGQLHAGAIAGVAAVLALSRAPAGLLLPLALAAGALAGAFWAWVPALMRMRLGVGEVITTLLMNSVALFLVQYLVQGPLRESNGVFNQTDALPLAAQLPLVFSGTRLHWGFPMGLAAALALWVFLYRTPGGFRVRAVGASLKASRVSGRFDPAPTLWGTFLVSGALAGLAGWIQVAGVTHRMYEQLSPGWGYTAIAVALLARLNPLGVVLAAILFGALDAGSGAMQREAGVPAGWVRGIEALVILSVLAIDRGVQSGNRSREA